MYILANITKQFKPLKDKHPIFDEDGDDDQDNPFKQGSLLANMRESTESYQIEASFKHRGEVKRDENVVKKLDFDGKDGKKEGRPASKEKFKMPAMKKMTDVEMPVFEEDEDIEKKIEKRMREMNDLVRKEGKAMQTESIVSSRVKNRPDFQKVKKPQSIIDINAAEGGRQKRPGQPRECLKLIRLDAPVVE